MRIWGKVIYSEQVYRDTVIETDYTKRLEIIHREDELLSALTEIARELEIERPSVGYKHLKELVSCGRTAFTSSDFMDSVDFERFVIEFIA